MPRFYQELKNHIFYFTACASLTWLISSLHISNNSEKEFQFRLIQATQSSSTTEQVDVVPSSPAR